MGKHAYLIIANRNQRQLQILLDTLDDSRNDIFLLTDEKSLLAKMKFKVNFSSMYRLQSMNIYWGSYSQIEAELALFKVAAMTSNYDYYHLLSGMDLPLTNQDKIHNFFDNNPNKEFITYSAINDADRLSIRLHNYVFDKNFRSNNKLFNLINKVQFFVYKDKGQHRVSKDKVCFGSNWVSLENKLVKSLITNEEEIYQIFHNGYLVDELMIPIYLNLHPKFKKNIYCSKPVHDKPNEFQGNLRYINWWDGSPYTWKLKDYSKLEDALEKGHLFARKFDENIDNNIIVKIANNILK